MPKVHSSHSSPGDAQRIPLDVDVMNQNTMSNNNLINLDESKNTTNLSKSLKSKSLKSKQSLDHDNKDQ